MKTKPYRNDVFFAPQSGAWSARVLRQEDIESLRHLHEVVTRHRQRRTLRLNQKVFKITRRA